MPNPLWQYTPDKPETDISMRPVNMIFRNANILKSSIKNMNAAVEMDKILEFAFNAEKDSQYSISSKCVRVVTLPQPARALEAILKNPHTLETVMERLKKRKRWYMVVGYISCFDTELAIEKFKISGITVASQLPTEQMVTAMTAVPIPEGVLPNVGAGMQRMVAWDSMFLSQAPGEAIFAVEYCALHHHTIWKSLWAELMDRQLELEMEDFPQEHSPGKAFGDDDDDIIEEAGSDGDQEQDSVKMLLEREGVAEICIPDSESLPLRRINPANDAMFDDEEPEDDSEAAPEAPSMNEIFTLEI